MPQGLPRKIRIAFILQVVMVGLAVIAAGWLVSLVIRMGLMRAASESEAKDFFVRLSHDANYGLPHGRNFTSWYVPAGQPATNVPGEFAHLSPGYHDLDSRGLHVRVERQPAGTLYLAYDTQRIDRLMYAFAVLPMALGLIGVVAVSFLTYRVSKRLVTPVNWLARQVAAWDPRRPDIDVLAPHRLPADIGSGEARQLAQALHTLGERVEAFVARERNFTRDASHELRTPLTVIRVAADLLESEALSARGQRSLQRVQRASRDMEAVIDAFLILAREADIEPQREHFAVSDIVAEEVDKVAPLLEGKPVELRVVKRAEPELHAPSRVLAVMVGNLLSNACQYTDEGDIEVRIEEDRVSVRDTGIGMTRETLQRAFDPFYRADQDIGGMGLGLSVVRRLGERFGWPVVLESVPGSGTLATIQFVR
ncbi:HAMP domain-containing histidine kinase [Lysobacter sp. KIS68-7]|uniref:sensor histidine kinase n=1 Tax=Lysobacter sp. KIS68-7 TaxID=2904252 RepID=UPI001E2F67ED|nr:HAMP domain-containing sensor histidine kinase [Lysobacter sp. KIS68-7]UHQ20904.1 HAMP domain-containing histidine kinase [Lysobacter sp. KIS68-7]